VVAEAPASGAAIALRTTPSDTALGEEEYFLEPGGTKSRPILTIRGRTALAVLHGAVSLAWRITASGFYFDGDSVPAARPTAFCFHGFTPRPSSRSAAACPGTTSRQPTTWDDQDFRFFADQILRSGQNFHRLPHLRRRAVWRYDDGGQLVGGEPC